MKLSAVFASTILFLLPTLNHPPKPNSLDVGTAREVAYRMVKDTADLFNGKVHVDGCKVTAWNHARCSVRIVGPVKCTMKVYVGMNTNYWIGQARNVKCYG